MTTATVAPADSYPLLVSELPPVAVTRPVSWFSALLQRRAARREQTRLEQLIDGAGPQERTDLLHALRRG